MRHPNTTTCGLLATAATATVLLLQSTASSAAPPKKVELMGVVWDFLESHPDFEVVPTGGNGQFSGNMKTTLGGDGRPVFVPGAGYKVATAWTDNAGREIAPNLAAPVEDTEVTVLFVVVNAASLTAQESARKVLIESWGYTVSLIGEGAPMADYDAALAVVDVAFVSEEISSGSVSTKLTSATVGVVNEEPYLSDELGVSTSRTATTATDLLVGDTGHFITGVFSTGPLTIFSSNQSVFSMSGALAPDLRGLAGWATGVSLGTLEAGSVMAGGGIAAGRRVELPWGGGSFDFNSLTADGRTLLHRALEWAADSTVTAPDMPDDLLLVVVNPASLTGQEAARKMIIESWGYTVTLIGESQPQVDFDTAAANNDVAYISEEIVSGNVNTKLVNATIGVVNEEGWLTDEFGIASGRTTPTDRSLVITDNSHPVTSTFGMEAVHIFTSNQPVIALSGTLADELTTLGTWGSSPSLGVLEVGDWIDATSVAAGRRVQLPWGGGAFDITTLTADGERLMHEAVNWAAATKISGSSPGDMVGQWRLDDGGGLVATDDVGSNHGNLMGDPQWVTGIDGGALELDGDGDYINIPSHPSLNFPADYTIAGWFKLKDDFTSSMAESQILVEKTQDNNRNMLIALVGNDFLRPEMARGSIVFKIENGPDTLHYRYKWTNRTHWDADVWYHFACVVKRDNTFENKIFINGVDDTSADEEGGTPVIDVNFDADVNIGGRYSDPYVLGGNKYFEGMIDDIRIYRQALSEDYFPPLDTGCVTINDAPGNKAVTSDGGITSAATFARWFRDTAGVNRSKGHVLTLEETSPGIYSSVGTEFYPIDGKLLGNEGASHNTSFTYMIKARFTYSECAGQFVEFSGGDGTWIFIDEKLVLDLGGIKHTGKQYIELDRLDLVDGEDYDLHFFFAERNGTSADFKLTTDLELSTEMYLPMYSDAFD